MIKNIFVSILLIAAFTNINAQSRSNTTAEIKVSLVRGMTLEASGSSFSFGEKSSNSEFEGNLINQENGLKYLATGLPNRNATISYDNSVTLTGRSVSSPEKQEHITFTTSTAQQTGTSPDYKNPLSLTSGSTASLDNDGGTGKIYIWLGGRLDVPSEHPQGDYSGTFNISIAY